MRGTIILLLYLYFEGAKMRGRTSEVVRWFMSAVSKDETMPALCKPYYDAEYEVFVATDGYRMHIWEVGDAEHDASYWLGTAGARKSGYFEIAGDGTITRIDWEHTFPDWRSAYTEYSGRPILARFNRPETSIVRFYVDYGIPIRYKHLKALIPDVYWEVRADNGKDKAIEFKSGSMKAILIPLNMERLF